METMKAIAKRKSVRGYKPEQLPEETLNRILAAGCAAPVGMRQYDSIHLTVAQSPDVLALLGNGVSNVMRKMMNRELGETFNFFGAPTVIVISSKEPVAEGINYTNAGNIAENMLLAATDAGVGSCFVWGTGIAVEEDAQLKTALGIPEDFKALFGLVFGYAQEDDAIEKDLQITISTNRV